MGQRSGSQLPLRGQCAPEPLQFRSRQCATLAAAHGSRLRELPDGGVDFQSSVGPRLPILSSVAVFQVTAEGLRGQSHTLSFEVMLTSNMWELEPFAPNRVYRSMIPRVRLHACVRVVRPLLGKLLFNEPSEG